MISFENATLVSTDLNARSTFLTPRDTHDFPDKELGKAIPYGVYDIDSNEAWVSVGISRDTGEFAVEAIRCWWRRLGKKRYAKPRRLLITVTVHQNRCRRGV